MPCGNFGYQKAKDRLTTYKWSDGLFLYVGKERG